MAIPVTIPRLRTYYDPQLWTRLEPELLEHIQQKSQHLLDGRFETLEAAREMVGYLRALEYVLKMADELTKMESRKEERDDI